MDSGQELIPQLTIHNNDLGEMLHEIAALTRITVEVDFANLSLSTQHQFFMLVDDKVISAVALQGKMSALLELA